MIENLPVYIPIGFGIITFATLQFFIWTMRNSDSSHTRKLATPIFILLCLWLTIQAVMAYSNLYNSDTNTLPPRIVVTGIAPMIVTIVLLFATSKGRRFIDSLPLINLTYINTVRVFVEIVLYWLFLNKAIPEVMTFEGRNFDILAGITAPIVAYYGLTKKRLSRQMVLIWNVMSLGLLVNIVVHALLSTPSPIQKFGLDQPNVAILNFPFNWLPTFIVPIVLFGHLVSIRRLLYKASDI